MEFYQLLSLLIFTLGTFSFAWIALLWWKQETRLPCGEPAGGEEAGKGYLPRHRRDDWCYEVLLVLCLLWFPLNLLLTLSEITDRRSALLSILVLLATFSFPPLILESIYRENRAVLGGSRFWRWSIGATYLISGLFAVLVLVAFFQMPLVRRFGFSWSLVGTGIGALFVWVAVYGVLAMRRVPRVRESREEKGYRRWSQILLWVFLLVFLPFLFGWWDERGRYFSLIGRSMPLGFYFVGTYYHERFVFFDVFVKRGSYLLVCLVGLSLFFALVTPHLEGVAGSAIRFWLYTILLLPLLLAAPWLYRKLETAWDRFWLGRRWSRLEAIKAFLAGLREATTPEQLVREAEVVLQLIFQAEARIHLGEGGRSRKAPAGGDRSLLVSVPSSGAPPVAEIWMGPRQNQLPYYSEDRLLLSFLADVFSFVLANLQLQARKREQERREKELQLNASRSELKALRAQINPHFLFNALNAIASLIDLAPQKAEETVEQLSEVFRYTLTRSEQEWVCLEEELAFIRAYLEVEKARFGERLEAQIEAEKEVLGASIPTMVVQTLVENAVKHGIAQLRSGGRLKVWAGRCGSRLRIEVRDNGPGLEIPSDPSGRHGLGFGLKSIRERLKGYFGAEGSLTLTRREGYTVAAVELPWERLPRKVERVAAEERSLPRGQR